MAPLGRLAGVVGEPAADDDDAERGTGVAQRAGTRDPQEEAFVVTRRRSASRSPSGRTGRRRGRTGRAPDAGGRRLGDRSTPGVAVLDDAQRPGSATFVGDGDAPEAVAELHGEVQGQRAARSPAAAAETVSSGDRGRPLGPERGQTSGSRRPSSSASRPRTSRRSPSWPSSLADGRDAVAERGTSSSGSRPAATSETVDRPDRRQVAGQTRTSATTARDDAWRPCPTTPARVYWPPADAAA